MREAGSVLAQFADRLALAAAGLAVLIMAGLCVMILLEIVLRQLGTSTYMLDEFGGYAIAALTFLSMAYTLRHGEMIRVQILVSLLSGKARRLVEVVCALLAGGAFGIFTWYLGRETVRSFVTGKVGTGMIEIPQWIPSGVVFIGAFLLVLQFLVYAIELLINPTRPLYQSDRAID